MFKILSECSMKKIPFYLLKPFTDVNSKRSTSGDNLRPLDGIRGIAVLVVIASHTSAFGMYGQGILGVLLFFMLSGFVLTIPYANSPRRLFTRSELLRFFVNRALRIMPLFIVAVILMSWHIGTGPRWILSNVLFYQTWNHFWSVAEEARFYVLFPIIMGLLALMPNRVMRILTLGVIICLAWQYRTFHCIWSMDNGQMQLYFWFFLGGVMTCLFYTAPLAAKLASNRLAKVFFINFSVLILVFLFLSSNQMISQFWQILFPNLPENFSLNGWAIPEVWFFLFMIFFFSVTVFQNSWVSRFLQSWPLQHLGLLSYSLYLFHMQILDIVTSKIGFQHESLFITVLTVTYLVALLTYIIIEKPFLMLKPKLVPSKVLLNEPEIMSFSR